VRGGLESQMGIGKHHVKICVLGAGALGCAIGGALTEAGHEVWLVSRNAKHVEVMNRVGLTVRSGSGDGAADRVIKVKAATHADGVDLSTGLVELVIVLVKSFHTREVMESAGAILGKDTLVLSLQNGVGHEDVLAGAVGRDRVLAGKTYAGGVMLSPGHIIAGVRGKETIIGELSGDASARAQRVAAVFNAAGLATTVSANIMVTIWEKLFVNVATGALSGITGLTYGLLYQVPEVEACAVAAVAEAMAVARAAGIPVTTTDPRAPWVKAAAGLPFEFKASMLQSLENGSITEIDYVNGAVVELGRKYGVPTPVNQTLVACMKGVEKCLPPCGVHQFMKV
jgi:2-dehydropantoate 2-reductase